MSEVKKLITKEQLESIVFGEGYRLRWAFNQADKLFNSLPDAPQWISVEDRLPEKLTRVLASLQMFDYLGKPMVRTTIAEYLPARTVLEEDYLSSDGENYELVEYDEEKDCYWCLENWYESNIYHEENYQIIDKVVAWMPLPETHKED